MICGIYFLHVYVGIGQIPFQSVPFCIGLKLVIVDGHFEIALHLQELVVTALVDVVFGQCSPVVGLLKPADPFLAVIWVLTSPFLRISDKQPLSVALVIFNHLTVALGLPKNPILYNPALILDPGSDDIFVTVRFKVRNVIVIHKTGVSHHDEVVKLVFAHKLRNHRKHGVSLVFIALVNAVSQRVAVDADQQTKYYLRALVPSLFWETCLAQIILVIRFKIQRCDIIEQHSDIASEYLPCMLHAYILYYLMLAVTELVKITVYLRQADILVKMVFQVFNRGSLACRIWETRFYQLPEYVIPYAVESDIVKDAVKNQIRSINGDVRDAGQHLFRT